MRALTGDIAACLPRRTVQAFAFSILALLGVVHFTLKEPWSPSPGTQLDVPYPMDMPQVLSPSRPKKRVYLRAGSIGKEGLGSALQHFKHSIVLSRALDSTLVLASNWNRVYSNSEIFNARLNREDFTVDALDACRLQDHLPQEDRAQLVRGLCSGESAAIEKADQLRAIMRDCTSILDLEDVHNKDDEWHGEVTEDLNGCIVDWVRERLAPATPLPLPAALTYPLNRPITVGIHIRWDDTANSLPEGEFYFSMSMKRITRVLADMRATFGPRVEVMVAMRNADESVLAPLREGGGTYTLIDTRDRMDDLRTLSRNDVLLVGESSYAVLAHLMAPPGLTIVQTGHINHGKYFNTSGFGRNMLFFQDYTPASLWSGLGLVKPEGS